MLGKQSSENGKYQEYVQVFMDNGTLGYFRELLSHRDMGMREVDISFLYKENLFDENFCATKSMFFSEI